MPAAIHLVLFKPHQVEVRECQTSPQLPREGQTDDSQEMGELSDGNTSVGEFSEHNSAFYMVRV